MSGRLVFDDTKRVSAWVGDRCKQTSNWGDCYAIGAERDGEIVAGIVLNNYNGSNAFAHIAIEKPGKDTFALCRAFCDYAFRHCGLKRLTATASLENPELIEFDLKLGFENEFVMRDAARDGDLQVMVMWADKCPWLIEGGRYVRC